MFIYTKSAKEEEMSLCAYCSTNSKLTKEHIYTDKILEIFQDIAPLTFDENRATVHSGDPVIRDLCGRCNSGLSNADNHVAEFAQKYCLSTISNGQILSYDKDLMELWVVKTAANCERSYPDQSKTKKWWHNFRGYLQKKDTKPKSCDIFFAPWVDKAPLPGMNPVYEIASSTVTIISEAYETNITETFLERGWAIKIGHGVFAALIWNENVSAPDRLKILNEIRSWGWLLIGTDTSTTKYPFNHISSTTFQVLHNPNDLQAYKKLRN